MQRPRRLEILAALTIVLCLGWANAGLAFRFAIYSSMPVAPGDPYGEADVMEVFHYGALLLLIQVAPLDRREEIRRDCIRLVRHGKSTPIPPPNG